VKLDAQPVGVDSGLSAYKADHRRIGVDFPDLRSTVDDGIVNAPVVDVSAAGDVAEKACVRIFRDVCTRLA
jgi:hypothetical protein